MYLPPNQQHILADIAALKKEEQTAVSKKEVAERPESKLQESTASRPGSQVVVRGEESAKKLPEGSQDESVSLQESNLESQAASVAAINDQRTGETPRGK